jgi:hypothetical protein
VKNLDKRGLPDLLAATKEGWQEHAMIVEYEDCVDHIVSCIGWSRMLEITQHAESQRQLMVPSFTWMPCASGYTQSPIC